MNETAPTERHYPIDGRNFVRVTALLRSVGAADFSKIPEKDRQFYMERGTATHKMWQDAEEGNAEKFDYDPRVQLYRVAHARFLRETGFKALPGGIELRVKATWRDLGLVTNHPDAGIAGTLDRIGTIQNRVVLIDYKTTSVPDSTRLQTALYLMMLPGYKFDEVERYGVAFRNDGTYSMSPRYPASDRGAAMDAINRFLKGVTL